MILFKNNITFQILRTYCDSEGRFIICDMTTNGKQLTLVNLYAPNDDDPNFFTWGRGFWKLNSSFLKDEEYVNQIREIIAQTKDEYEQDDTVTPGLLWEMIKMKAKEASINYGKTKKILSKSKTKLKNQSKSARNKLLTHTWMTPKNYGQNKKRKDLNWKL